MQVRGLVLDRKGQQFGDIHEPPPRKRCPAGRCRATGATVPDAHASCKFCSSAGGLAPNGAEYTPRPPGKTGRNPTNPGSILDRNFEIQRGHRTALRPWRQGHAPAIEFAQAAHDRQAETRTLDGFALSAHTALEQVLGVFGPDAGAGVLFLFNDTATPELYTAPGDGSLVGSSTILDETSACQTSR